MRGPDVMQDTLFAVRSLESYVPAAHPLRPVRDILNEALRRMDRLFATMYAPAGRDSIAPEKLLRALMLQVLYGVRSERMLIEQLGYNLLFRWFVGVSMQDDPWDHSTFSKNRDRLIAHDTCAVLFEEVLAQARAKGLLSAEHFGGRHAGSRLCFVAMCNCRRGNGDERTHVQLFGDLFSVSLAFPAAVLGPVDRTHGFQD